MKVGTGQQLAGGDQATPLPGIKPGLANIVTLLVLQRHGWRATAWVTGLRREDSPLRADTPLVEWDPAHQMVKINPVAAWTFDELLDYAGSHGVPINLLLTEGYPSIGCAPSGSSSTRKASTYPALSKACAHQSPPSIRA